MTFLHFHCKDLEFENILQYIKIPYCILNFFSLPYAIYLKQYMKKRYFRHFAKYLENILDP